MHNALRPSYEIALFYPSGSLAKQAAAWGRRHPECAVRLLFTPWLPAIRAALYEADVALVDATHDDARAIDAFSQSATQLGAQATAVYSEQLHEGLELFVRSRGSLLLWGPLSDAQWDELLDRLLAQGPAHRGGRLAA